MSKYLCLTFDDGPNNIPGDTTMNDMLDILEKYEVPASFFLIGNKITEENKKVIRRAVELGCDIQNHSWTHSFMAQMTPEQIKDEYKNATTQLQKLPAHDRHFSARRILIFLKQCIRTSVFRLSVAAAVMTGSRTRMQTSATTL